MASTKMIYAFTVGACLMISSAYAQPQQNISACTDKLVHTELVMLDKELENRGFSLMQFHTVNMPSGAYVPFSLKMEAGQMYQLNFIGQKEFKEYTFTLIDRDKKKLINRKVKPKGESDNRISESFVAPYTGQYIVVLRQKIKGGAEACGGFSVLKAEQGGK